MSGLGTSYGAVAVLHEVSLEVRPGDRLRHRRQRRRQDNAAQDDCGRSPSRQGHVLADGRDISGRPSWWVARHGITLVPEGRGVFADQSVRDNLMLGALPRRSARDAAAVGADLETALALFPALAGKLDLPAGALSGGQQQMLAVARGLMAKPRVLLLDEPSLGLAPILVREIFAAIERLRAQGVTVLLVEQMAAQALALADRAYVLDRGRIVLEGPAREVRESPAVVDAYLGRRGGGRAP